ncbi:hypothetical protein DKZ29_01690 [Limosilactobacillus reuteri]|uniref:Uncharacterized protein n=1 Tax=Limosilactobacillus reuteri TaxID=1598 RepID=A0A855XMJ3_LIMRT|nr:hypothetical protein [Limosilactobacillus reuteri]PWT33879.1 hypothetical protein DKZ21_01145 [Limosilactobacillus reuteri]PWT39905.1 hypothetical protein DKZ22_09990 [Limosilactobacillus reuteri]PWT45344.1 hypothetical protein DKZ25_01145 [Limosilactobacillus reuteri]PWT60063.1 hypothetical protein DKZ29_01690 [Limosilactobacillus reuteri]PWT68112.1 hypothetical protein DKZ26_11095 [Limosilactobacillus reuteri]
MIECYLIVNGRSDGSANLSAVPNRGDIISLGDHKAPHYLVHRVEYLNNSDTVNLHVQKFANEVSCVNAVSGYRNDRSFVDEL